MTVIKLKEDMLTRIDSVSAQQGDSEIGYNPERQSVIFLSLFLILRELTFICLGKQGGI